MRKYSLLCIRWIFVVSFSLYLLLIIFCCCIPLSSLCSLLFFTFQVECLVVSYIFESFFYVSLFLSSIQTSTQCVFLSHLCAVHSSFNLNHSGPRRALALCILIWFLSTLCTDAHSVRFALLMVVCVCVHLLYVISRKHLLQWNASDFYIFFFVLLCVLFSESCIVLWTLRGFCCWEYCKGRRNNNLYFIQSRISSTCLFLLCLSTFSLHLDPLTCICPTIPNQRGKKCRVT